MNWLDRLLAPLAPGFVAQRLRHQAVIQAYEAARPTRTHKAKGEARSANMALQAAGRSLREQCRWLDENHDIVTGIFDRLEERVVGGAGIGIEPLVLDLAGEVHLEFCAQIKTAWAEWSLRPETSGELSRPQMERLMCRTWLRDGEGLAQKVMGNVAHYRHLTRVPFALELLEPDYLPFELNDTAKGIIQGIERDAWRRVRAYHLLKAHPGDMGHGIYQATKRVEAERVIHIAYRKRIGQNRGVPLLHAALIRLADLKDYEESERIAARIGAAIAFYIKKGEPQDYEAPNGDIAKRGSFPIAPGMVFDDLRPGEDIGMFESNRPNPMLEGFRNGMLRAVAAAGRSAYSTVSRSYDGTYSAQRQELVEAQLGYDQLQHEFIDYWCRPVYRTWLPLAIASGVLKPPADVDLNTLYAAVYQGPVMPWINPMHEAQAWELLVKGGFADEAEVARSRGRDPQELKRSRIGEIKKNREEGLVFSSDAFHDVPVPDQLTAVEAVQKAYLGVGKMITAEEARELVNQHGAGLKNPPPDFTEDNQKGGAHGEPSQPE
ncbi:MULTISPECIES: phage portal protein [unclassified Pseudomonas]|uniref:phage portal protein n=1 Tax=unclassified Pseudomonas TaxID=196821 RepID=UPI002447EFC0|nr:MULTISPECIES: phage portal protein [unclassified Pseudomonas]MDG9928264.1 phage portal protein [Pseudomonas sp. GD04042]MDH0481172.1 phage portal protein [Pseudomonas sp. GD04015]MDH0604508.1 phage portal protein [Pseudomonas sp. GD03869]